MINNISYTSLEGLALLILMVLFGKAFRENWKMKDINTVKAWLIKAWIYGLLSSISFFFFFLVHMKN